MGKKGKGVPVYRGTKAATQRNTKKYLTKVHVIADEMNHEPSDSVKDISKEVRKKQPSKSHNTRKDRVVTVTNDIFQDLPKNELNGIRKNLSVEFSNVMDLPNVDLRNVDPPIKEKAHTMPATNNGIGDFLRQVRSSVLRQVSSRVFPFGRRARIHPKEENVFQVKNKPGNKTKVARSKSDEFLSIVPKGGNRKTQRCKKPYTK